MNSFWDNVKPGTGVLFVNKTENPKAPHFKGVFKIKETVTYPAGSEIKLSCWKRQTKNGEDMLSIVEDTFVPNPEMRQHMVQKANAFNIKEDDDVPF